MGNILVNDYRSIYKTKLDKILKSKDLNKYDSIK